jgi:hypothetical protein
MTRSASRFRNTDQEVDSMNRHSVRIACAVAVIIVGLAGAAAAQSQPACSNATLRGAWGYTETGSVIAPTAGGGTIVVTAAAVGRYEFDRAGNFEGEQNSSANGAVGADTKQGTYVIKADCTGTLTLTAFRDGVAQRLSIWTFVVVDNGREMRAIMTSMTLPNGTPLAPIMTLTARKVHPGRANRE